MSLNLEEADPRSIRKICCKAAGVNWDNALAINLRRSLLSYVLKLTILTDSGRKGCNFSLD